MVLADLPVRVVALGRVAGEPAHILDLADWADFQLLDVGFLALYPHGFNAASAALNIDCFLEVFPVCILPDSNVFHGRRVVAFRNCRALIFGWGLGRRFVVTIIVGSITFDTDEVVEHIDAALSLPELGLFIHDNVLGLQVCFRGSFYQFTFKNSGTLSTLTRSVRVWPRDEHLLDLNLAVFFPRSLSDNIRYYIAVDEVALSWTLTKHSVYIFARLLSGCLAGLLDDALGLLPLVLEQPANEGLCLFESVNLVGQQVASVAGAISGCKLLLVECKVRFFPSELVCVLAFVLVSHAPHSFLGIPQKVLVCAQMILLLSRPPVKLMKL